MARFTFSERIFCNDGCTVHLKISGAGDVHPPDISTDTFLALHHIVWVDQENHTSRKDAKHAKENLAFHAGEMDYQASIIISWRALRLCESNIVL